MNSQTHGSFWHLCGPNNSFVYLWRWRNSLSAILSPPEKNTKQQRKGERELKSEGEMDRQEGHGSRRQGIGVVSGELSGVTAHWGLDGWAGGESRLRIWELFGLLIVPGLLFALHWRFNPASSLCCRFPVHHRSQGSSVLSLKSHANWRTCAGSKGYGVMLCTWVCEQTAAYFRQTRSCLSALTV